VPRKQIHDIIDECYMVHSYEMAAKGKSLALSVAIPKALVENDYDITLLDDTVWTEFADLLHARLSHWATKGSDPRTQVAEIIIDFQNAGLLVRKRA
jgi:hypothetical protein